MITYLFLTIIISLIGVIFTPLSSVTELPWGLDDIISQGVGGYKLLATAFPPFDTMLTIFLIYASFRLGMLFLKFFLGSRTPSHV